MNKDEQCVIKCISQRNLVSGYTKVKIMPENYASITMISGFTGKTIQDVTDELLAYAISHVQVMQNNGSLINLGLVDGGLENEHIKW